jgi:hypothetical protein
MRGFFTGAEAGAAGVRLFNQARMSSISDGRSLPPYAGIGVGGRP